MRFFWSALALPAVLSAGCGGDGDGDDWTAERIIYFEEVDDQTIELSLDYCGEDYRAEVVDESVEEVGVSVETRNAGNVDCSVLVQLELREPLSSRAVVNRGTGERVPPN